MVVTLYIVILHQIILFATDIGMIVDIFKDDYKGKCIFTDLDVNTNTLF